MKVGDCLTEHLKQMNALTDKLLEIVVIEEEHQMVTLLGGFHQLLCNCDYT